MLCENPAPLNYNSSASLDTGKILHIRKQCTRKRDRKRWPGRGQQPGANRIFGVRARGSAGVVVGTSTPRPVLELSTDPDPDPDIEVQLPWECFLNRQCLGRRARPPLEAPRKSRRVPEGGSLGALTRRSYDGQMSTNRNGKLIGMLGTYWRTSLWLHTERDGDNGSEPSPEPLPVHSASLVPSIGRRIDS